MFVDEKAPADSLLRVSKEIVAIHQNSQPGLRYLAQAYQDLNQSDSVVVTLTRLLQTDPSNATMVSQIVEVIASTANPSIARPIIEKAVADNPGDPDLLRLHWRILMAVRAYKEGFEAGENLVKLDTANADTTYFKTTALAYQRDSAPQKAAETASRGVAKFPDNASLIFLQVSSLRAAGQAQQALEALDRAIAAKITVPDAGLLRLTLMREMGKPTAEILPVARAAIAAGDTTASVRQIILQAITEQFRAGQASKSIPDLETALATANYADTIATPAQKPQVYFMLGAIHTTLGQMKIVQAGEQKNCELAKVAKNHFADAQINLPKGGAFQPEGFKTLMAQVMGQLDPYADQVIKALACK
jgi:tetratricopeptide (TPR) repeat protein